MTTAQEKSLSSNSLLADALTRNTSQETKDNPVQRFDAKPWTTRRWMLYLLLVLLLFSSSTAIQASSDRHHFPSQADVETTSTSGPESPIVFSHFSQGISLAHFQDLYFFDNTEQPQPLQSILDGWGVDNAIRIVTDNNRAFPLAINQIKSENQDLFPLIPQVPFSYNITAALPSELLHLDSVTRNPTEVGSLKPSRILPSNGKFTPTSGFLLFNVQMSPDNPNSRLSLPLDPGFLALISAYNAGQVNIELRATDLIQTARYTFNQLNQNGLSPNENLTQNASIISSLVNETYFQNWQAGSEPTNMSGILAHSVRPVLRLDDGTGYFLVWRLALDTMPLLDADALLQPEHVASDLLSYEQSFNQAAEVIAVTPTPTSHADITTPQPVITEVAPAQQVAGGSEVSAPPNEIDIFHPELQQLVSIERHQFTAQSWEELSTLLWQLFGTNVGADTSLLANGRYPLESQALLDTFWQNRQASDPNTITGVMVIPDNAETKPRQLATLDLSFSVWQDMLQQAHRRGFNVPTQVRIIYVSLPPEQINLPYQHTCFIDGARTPTPCTTINQTTQLAWPPDISWIAIDNNPSHQSGLNPFTISRLFPQYRGALANSQTRVRSAWVHEQNHLLDTADTYRYKLQTAGFGLDANGALAPLTTYLSGWERNNISDFAFDQWGIMHGGNPYLSDFDALQIAAARLQGITSTMFEGFLPYSQITQNRLVVSTAYRDGRPFSMDNALIMLGNPQTSIEHARHSDALLTENQPRIGWVSNGSKFSDIRNNYVLGVEVFLSDSSKFTLPIPQIFPMLDMFRDPQQNSQDDYQLIIGFRNDAEQLLASLQESPQQYTIHTVLATGETFSALSTSPDVRILAEAHLPIDNTIYQGSVRMVWVVTPTGYSPFSQNAQLALGTVTR